MMGLLFTPGRIGSLELPNRIVRSATAERMADNIDGRPTPRLRDLWVELVKGGTGLIITGHMFIHPSGKCHPEMSGIHKDELVPEWEKITSAVHKEGGKIAVQINHGGMQCSKDAVNGTLAPSAMDDDGLEQPAREISSDEIAMLIYSFAQAARRAKEAGFDAVQIHGAHGYLINQFLSPFTNRRIDKWGGDEQGRSHFLRQVIQAVREQVGNDYPVFIKFGVLDGVDGGLTLDISEKVISQLADQGLDGVEVSGGFRASSTMKGIKSEAREAYFRPFAKLAQKSTDLPIILIGGMRTRKVMVEILESGDADFIAMCRPLINTPHFPALMKSGIKEKSDCISSNNCGPKKMGEGISCKCPLLE
jgi:2,4-dienoyl-CoA reductase-like NADH-dependent reductase (Old Yellow Enzyme family)